MVFLWDCPDQGGAIPAGTQLRAVPCLGAGARQRGCAQGSRGGAGARCPLLPSQAAVPSSSCWAGLKLLLVSGLPHPNWCRWELGKVQSPVRSLLLGRDVPARSKSGLAACPLPAGAEHWVCGSGLGRGSSLPSPGCPVFAPIPCEAAQEEHEPWGGTA